MCTMEGLPAAQDTAGRRRFAHGPLKNTFTYYTFEQYLGYFLGECAGDADQARELALSVWNTSVDEEDELEAAKKYMVEVQALPAVPIDEIVLAGGGAVLLQSVGCAEGQLAGPPGGCLRKGARAVDCWGGIWPKAVMTIEVVKTHPSLQVHIRCNSGGCLLFDGQGLRFAGCFDTAPVDAEGHASVFELLPREGPLPMLTLAAACGGPCIGTFVPRRAPPELAQQAVGATAAAMLRDQVVAAARGAASLDATFRGRRRHKQDLSGKYYPFEEMALYVQRTFQTTDALETMQLAEPLWRVGCVAEAEDEKWSFVEDVVIA